MPKEIKLNLPTSDSLFSTQEQRDDNKRERVIDLPLCEIDSFPDHPYPVEMDDKMLETIETVRAYGVHTPALLRPKEDGRYELVSGHRRKMACEIVGLDTMPCIVRQMSSDEAIIIMVDSNVQRESVPPSVKAKAYKMRLDAMKRQGKRTDLTSVENQQKLKGVTSRKQLSEKTGDSEDKIRNLIRLNELIPQVLQMVDKGKIAMRPAVELSYLTPDEQQILHETIEYEECTPSHVQAAKMRKFSEEGRLNEDVILSIMQEEKPNQIEQFKMPRDKINRFFPVGTPAQKIEETIVKALELYRQRERNRKDAR